MSELQAILTENGAFLFRMILLYLLVISLLSVGVTIADKRFSRRAGHRRVPESTLLWYAVFGGALSMLITMLLIRHKTRHAKFMVGLPLILFLQAAAAAAISVFVL